MGRLHGFSRDKLVVYGSRYIVNQGLLAENIKSLKQIYKHNSI